MTPIFIGKCFDVLIPFGVGLIGLIYYPRRIAKDIEFRKRSEEDGKKWLKKVKFVCWFDILFGIYKITDFFH